MSAGSPAGCLQNRGSKIVATDRLREIALKARRTRSGISDASRDEGDRRHPAPLAHVHVAQSLEEAAAAAGARSHTMTSAISATRMASGAGRCDNRPPKLDHRAKDHAPCRTFSGLKQ